MADTNKYIDKISAPNSLIDDLVNGEGYKYVGITTDVLRDGEQTNFITLIDGTEYGPEANDLVICKANGHAFVVETYWEDRGSCYDVYNLKDAYLRTELESLDTSGAQFIGKTTTKLVDGSTVTEIALDSGTHTAKVGDVVIYDNELFLYTTANVWNLMGSTYGLGKLAFAASMSGDLTYNAITDHPTEPGEYVTTVDVSKLTYDRLYERDSKVVVPAAAAYSFSTQQQSVATTGTRTANYEKFSDTSTPDHKYLNITPQLSVTPTKKQVLLSAVLGTDGRDNALYSIDDKLVYVGAKTLNTVTNTYVEDKAFKAPTFATPTKGVAPEYNEEVLPTLYGLYAADSHTVDPLSGETIQCGTLTFVWEDGEVDSITPGTGIPTSVTLPASGDYTPVKIPDTTSVKLLAKSGDTALDDFEILESAVDDAFTTVPTKIKSTETAEVITGFTANKSSCTFSSKDSATTGYQEIAIGNKYTYDPAHSETITGISGTVSIPVGVTIGTKTTTRYIKDITEETDNISGSASVTVVNTPHEITFKAD